MAKSNSISKVLLRKLTLALLLTVLVAGCEGIEDTGQASLDLKIAVTPGIEAVPLFIALEEELFEAAGIAIELVLLEDNETVERALRAGAVDGGLGSIFSLFRMQEQGFLVMASSSSGIDYLLVASTSYSDSFENLSEAQVVLPEGVMERFLLEELLRGEGLEADEMKIREENNGGKALEAFIEGRADAVFLPRILGEEAVAGGGVSMASTLEMELTGGVIIFSGEALQEREEEINLFYESYSKAVETINKADLEHLVYLWDKHGFPKGWLDHRAALFQELRPVTPEDVSNSLAWFQANEEFNSAPVFEGLVWRRLSEN